LKGLSVDKKLFKFLIKFKLNIDFIIELILICVTIFIEKTEFIDIIKDDNNNINNINVIMKLSIHNNPLYNITPLYKKL
jgi:hypothetical protein